jgi:hypothetical protein
LNDSQFNYIYELLSVIKNKVLEISNDESERSDIYVDNLKIDKSNTDRVITLKYFIRYHNITEIGIEKYTNDEETEEDGKKETGEDGKKETEDIYLTFGVYGDCNIDFNKIGINELVEKDEDDQNEYAEATSVDSETIEFNLELTKVQ